MLRNNRAEFTKHVPPLVGMLPAEKLMQVPDGVLVAHLLPRHMPKNAIQKRCKLVHIYRNPKDVIVSFFNFIKKTKDGAMMQDMEFDVFFELYITDQCKLNNIFIYRSIDRSVDRSIERERAWFKNTCTCSFKSRTYDYCYRKFS